MQNGSFYTLLVLVASLGTFPLLSCSKTSGVASSSSSSAKLTQCAAAVETVDSATFTSFTITPPTSTYLMTFHSCKDTATDCTNPTEHEVRLAQSNDGNSWSEVSGWTRYKGSVPDVHRRESTLYVSGGGLAKVNLSTGVVTAGSLTVLDSSGNNAQARDFAFAGENSAGLMYAVYVPSMQAEGTGSADSPQYVYLATEVEGSDGSCFETTRALVSITDGSFGMGGPTDPDLFFDGNQYVLYVSFGANVFRFTSATMDGTFGDKTQLSSGQGGVPTGLYTGSTILSFVNYGLTNAGSVIKVASHSASATNVIFTTTAVPSNLSGAQSAESPGVILNVP